MLTRKTALFVVTTALTIAACDNADKRTEPNPSAPAPAATDKTPSDKTTTTGATMTNPTVAATPNTDPAKAENVSDVKRYPEENKVAPTTAKVTATSATIRKAAQGGESITVVKSGSDVTELATAHDYVLVLTPDPKDSTKQLLGWVYKDSVSPAEGTTTGTTGAASGTSNDAKLGLGDTTHPSKGTTTGAAGAANAKGEKPLTCKTGEVKMQSDHDFCAKACREDTDCKASGALCDGEAKVIVPGGTLEKGRFCVGGSATTAPAAATAKK